MNHLTYVDGFVIPVAKEHLEAYKEHACEAGKIWMEYGALAYNEGVGEDLAAGEQTLSFLKMADCADNETVIFAWVVYRDRAHRDKVNAKVMADPRIQKMCVTCSELFDPNRMAYGGFQSFFTT
ncbi:MAG: DUF1428 domain-containing protein [Verrucomicrobiota bacterium JB023]|nr:DUF1428 domain-containing protein [Verrucomicrobiota bacterium JB023]